MGRTINDKKVLEQGQANVSMDNTRIAAMEASQPVKTRVTLTSAQVKALGTTPITLVDAPGAGKYLRFLGATLKLDYGGTNAFTESSDNLGIYYTDKTGVRVSELIETTGFIDQTADTYTSSVPIKDAIVTSAASVNAPLVIDNPNDAIAGNAGADNTLVIDVWTWTVTA